MRAGNLRHRVSIQEQTQIPDGMGGFTLTWAAKTGMDSVPAAIWDLSSKERLDAMKLESDVSSKIRIRYRPGITSKNRIVFGSIVYNILGNPVNYEKRNKYLDFIVSEQA
jgi:SPP1 family predicted phage head-tail adaptor